MNGNNPIGGGNGSGDGEIVILHLSDTHISAPGTNPSRPSPDYDSGLTMSRVMKRLEDSGLHPNLLVVSGDLCDAETGERARTAYRGIVASLRRLTAILGCPMACCMGNHDDREAFRSVILPACGSTGTAVPPIHGPRDDGSDAESAVDYSFTVPTSAGELRIVILDTSSPGSDRGDLDDTQLNWLKHLLKTCAPAGTILVMHHPPVHPWQFHARQWEMNPNCAATLGDMLSGTDVRVILCGHVHLDSAATFRGIPVSIAGAFSRNQDPLHPRELTYSWSDNPSMNIVMLSTIAHDRQAMIIPAMIAGFPVKDA